MQDNQQHAQALGDYVDLQVLHQSPGVRDTFPSSDSIKWFIRQHRAELVQRGALISLTGRLRFHPVLFQQVAVEIGRRTARLGGHS
jgi:hypothetical protein